MELIIAATADLIRDLSSTSYLYFDSSRHSSACDIYPEYQC